VFYHDRVFNGPKSLSYQNIDQKYCSRQTFAFASSPFYEPRVPYFAVDLVQKPPNSKRNIFDTIHAVGSVVFQFLHPFNTARHDSGKLRHAK
jgi:hypothetical protein